MKYNVYHVRANEKGGENRLRVATSDDREQAWNIWAELVGYARPGETYELKEEEDG